MSEYQRVPPGGAPVAGWYPDPGDPAHARYWDGHTWTDQVTAAPQPAVPRPALPAAPMHYTSGQGSSFGPVFFVGVVLVVLALIIGVFVYVGRNSSPAGGEDVAVGACRYFVAARLQAPASADFTDLEAIAPVSGEQWTVTGTVESRTPAGRVRRTDFTCTVEPSTGGWQLVSLRYPRT